MVAAVRKNKRLKETRAKEFILWFEDMGINDIPLVGGKNASLGELINQLQPKGVKVPGGFAVTTSAYSYFLQEGSLKGKLSSILAGLDLNNVKDLQRKGKEIRSLIGQTNLPRKLEAEIALAYQQLAKRYGEDPDVAVRSSATAEDLPDASFAGQQETYLNVRGIKSVIEACHKRFVSLFTDRAISYREKRGFNHLKVAISVGVQKMVRSDLACSGVMFSLDPETGFRNVALITAAYGLGENVVQGAVNPDEYVVFKPTLERGYSSILAKRMGSKELQLVYDSGGDRLTKNIPVPEAKRNKYCLEDEEILQLARWAIIIEDRYGRIRGVDTPMDIEWAKDGLTGELFVVQARPETVQSQQAANVLRTYQLQGKSDVLVRGRSIGAAIGYGKVRVIADRSHMHLFQRGEVLVSDRTDPDWEPIMKKAKAIVTNRGGKTCHAAIIAREMGIPAIVGCGNATEVLPTGEEVTVSCAEGDEGRVYAGLLPFKIEETLLDNLPRTRTQIMMNVGNPELAFSLANIPCDGVGLARLEFIIANQIKVHPQALLQFHRLEDEGVKAEIARLTQHYDSKEEYFISQLGSGVGTIAAAFYPKPVIVRLSDFKSNEYSNLLGGKQFEPKEENPMLGWRGASRYYDREYRQAFALECFALKRVRDEMGLTNVIPMVPFCRTPEEGRQVLAQMAEYGLKRGVNGLQVYMMCELPSNVILADLFAEVFDGFSIGSNDLTQLTLGLDRDSALVARLFDERHEGVKRMVAMAITTANRYHRKIGICGQAPSDYPEFARFLVETGIDSISLNPDSVLKTMLMVASLSPTPFDFAQGKPLPQGEGL